MVRFGGRLDFCIATSGVALAPAVACCAAGQQVWDWDWAETRDRELDLRIVAARPRSSRCLCALGLCFRLQSNGARFLISFIELGRCWLCVHGGCPPGEPAASPAEDEEEPEANDTPEAEGGPGAPTAKDRRSVRCARCDG